MKIKVPTAEALLNDESSSGTMRGSWPNVRPITGPAGGTDKDRAMKIKSQVKAGKLASNHNTTVR